MSIAPLISFRVLFGFMMVYGTVRFALKGWINELYIQPKLHFTYYGFDWVQALPGIGMYILFALVLLSAIGIMLGAFYRISSVMFFLSFTYIELIDKTTYLNHYYFVSLVAFILIFLPAHRKHSIDVYRLAVIEVERIPYWPIFVLQFQLAIVYFFAGAAKLNHFWLFEAMPLQLWLPGKTNIPVIGWMLQLEWVAYFFSWFGALYDLTIAGFLWHHRTRPFAFIVVIVFHLLTALLFQIGMFPIIMIFATTIFFSGAWHERIHQFFSNRIGFQPDLLSTSLKANLSPILRTSVMIFFIVQCLVPLRFALYPGSVFWHEQGYRFSWRVMLMEKAGHTTFRVMDDTGKKEWANNADHLTKLQEKMMSTQPDMILQYAHHLAEYYQTKGFINPQVFCDSQVTLNGRRSQALVDPAVDLAMQSRGFRNKTWILSFQET